MENEAIREDQLVEAAMIEKERTDKKTLMLLCISGGAALLLMVASALFLLTTPFGGGQPKDEEVDMPHAYTYGDAAASNGMELHYLLTRPSNVSLASIHTNVAAGPYYGVNGGFFYEEGLLSIAEVNGKPVNAAPGVYGAGDHNAKYTRGTLVWDGAADKLSVQTVGQADELKVADRAHFWAQGGISMSLDRDDLWQQRVTEEHAPNADDSRLRSGAVYDADGSLYLIVSTTKGTLAEFRSAVKEKIGAGRLVNGIFLDGDGSSQLRSREVRLSGDGRPVVQMMRLLE
ncbi:phosphodiester glycosidase family protein [Paenibacillus sp. R14(2021)]|uniref:phosphodiester glycosidase family protein n=1 Tax=Paenibacillus sp. R14(2021) TaxID=2859228 RepID=UPI00215863C2|nr:phosphodiester glycosidase family protein [Paenibacillus sp. R14(2021)]